MMKNQRIQVPNFQRATHQMEQLYGRTLPVKIASLAEGFFKESFRNQGFSDNGL